jgi:hypothetical protein
VTALTTDRNTPWREPLFLTLPVKAAVNCHAGGLAVLDGAYVKPGVTGTGLIAVGRFEAVADNTNGANGAISVAVRTGCFRWANSSGGDEITAAEIGDTCFIVDDQTVAKTSDSASRSPAGVIFDVDAQGVWVLMLNQQLAAPAGALLAANNLSDVATAATARGNIGANKIYLVAELADLSGTDAYHLVSPVAGDITGIRTVIDGALTTGDATVTADIGGTPVTDGAVTITQSGSAAGDTDTVTPSAANAVSAGDDIGLTIGGTNDAAVAGRAVIEITF